MTRVRLSVIGGVLLVVIVGVALWLLALSPRLAEADDLTQQATQLQTANLNLQRQYSESLDQARKAPEAAAEAQVLFAKMPQKADLPSVLDQITRAATDAGIDQNAIPTLTPGIPVPVTGTKDGAAAEKSPSGIQLARLDLNVAALGQRDQTLGFLDNLQAMDRVMLITSTQTSQVSQVSDAAATDLENLQVAGSMFVLESQLPDLVAEVEALLAQAAQDQPAAS